MKRTVANPSTLPDCSLAEVASGIRTGSISPVEVTEAVLARIAKLEPSLNSFTTVTADLARAEARQAEQEIARGHYRSPLHGIPISLKDLCFTKGIPTSSGMAMYRNFCPDYDATVVTRLRQAGAVCVGKTNMTEGATIGYHPDMQRPVNPWHPDYWSGVSSSGSGVAAAAGLCFATIGSDTGGSIRFPSAAAGITGLKPTWGRVSRHGIFPLGQPRDTIGPMARSAEDCAIMLSEIAGMDVNDPTSLTADVPNYAAQLAGLHGARGVRIGIDRQFNFSESDEEVVNLIEAAVSALQEIGGIVNAVKFPDPVALRGLSSSVSKVETALSHETTFPARAAEYGPALRELLFQAAAVDPLDMGRVLIAREEFKGALNHLFTGIDLLLVPVFAKQIPQWRVMADNPTVTVPWVFKFTAIFNHAGVPSITLPCGFTELGLPVAFQLIGPHLSEALLLRVGHAYQQATDWHMRRPPVVRDADQPAPAR